jgi:Holliday junction resolvase RusA-like endonuclease
MVFSAKITPVGKPRQTQSDRWKQRPAVMRYRMFADEIRYLAGNRNFSLPDVFSIVFQLPMPSSWSEKKQQAMIGTPHQQKPDFDNLVKSVCDALKVDDSTVWDVRVRKLWAKEGRIIICTEEDIT